MIKSKEDLKKYLEQDKKMLGREGSLNPKIIGDEVWKFQISLRKVEYYTNTKKNRLLELFWKLRYHRLSIKLGFSIPINVFEEGLNIHHYGCIVVNSHAKVGKNCNLQQGVNIGKNYEANNCPTIGDNVYLGPGCKLFGKIKIANGVAVGANSVVTKDCLEENVTIAGVPAKIIGKRKEGLK